MEAKLKKALEALRMAYDEMPRDRNAIHGYLYEIYNRVYLWHRNRKLEEIVRLLQPDAELPADPFQLADMAYESLLKRTCGRCSPRMQWKYRAALAACRRKRIRPREFIAYTMFETLNGLSTKNAS